MKRIRELYSHTLGLKKIIIPYRHVAIRDLHLILVNNEKRNFAE